MKLQTFFLLTHGATAAAIAMLIIAAQRTDAPSMLAVASALSLVTLIAASWYAAIRVRSGMKHLEVVVADQDECESLRSGLIEFDQSADRIASQAAQWESIAANNRRQAKEFQSMMFLLNRRGPEREPSSEQLRGLLAGLGNTLHAHLVQIQRGTTEIEQYTQTIADGAESQGSAVIKTTAYLEQLCSAIDTVVANTNDVEASGRQSAESVSAARTSLSTLTEGIQQARSDSLSCEKKLRGLCDPSQQIHSIVETICDIASRTDLLALNASIESIRAGEHGKRFAMVADEVRKLAEQAADATREISSLIDSMQLVTQESIHRIVRGREQLDAQVPTAEAIELSLQRICESADKRAAQVRQIKETSTSQLQLAQNVVLAVEQISEIAKASRSGADNATWTIKTLSKTSPDFDSAVTRLRQCGGAQTDSGEERRSKNVPAVPTSVTVPSPALATA